jgi:hypothetical protein
MHVAKPFTHFSFWGKITKILEKQVIFAENLENS